MSSFPRPLAHPFILTLLLLAVLSLSGCAKDEPSPTPVPDASGSLIERTLTVGEQVAVQIDNIRGSVTIRAGKEGTLSLRASRITEETEGSASQDAMTLAVVQSDDAVTIGTPRPARGWLSWFTEFLWPTPEPESLTLTLAVPEDTSVALRDVAGAVTIGSIKGGVSLQGGEVTASLSKIGGAVDVDIQDGRLMVDGGGGGEPCRLLVGAGAVWARKLSCESLEARGGRDLRLDETDVAGSATAVTRVGEVQVVRVRAEALESRTEQGRLLFQESTIAGEAVLTSGAGDIIVKRANAGTLRVTATRGNVECAETQGGLFIAATRGKVTLRRALARALEVRGGSAEVLVSGDFLPDERHRIETAGGNITLYVRRESSLRVQADTGAGSFIVDRALAPDAQPVQGKNVQELNGGAVRLEVFTGGGDVLLRTGDPLL